MPELPEVETVRRGLQRLLPGRKVVAVENDWAKSFPNAGADVQRFLIGAGVVAVARRAKVLLIELSSNYSLVIHLKMTGQLVFVGQPVIAVASSSKEHIAREAAIAAEPDSNIRTSKFDLLSSSRELRFGAGHPNDSLIGELPDKSTRVRLTFDDGSQLFFNDQRKFGWMRLLPTPEVMNLDFFQKVGPEPLAADFSWQDFRARLLRRPKSGIKAVLLDQTIIAGVGNIYADESLWEAKIHPLTPVHSLNDRQIKVLRASLRAVLRLSIDKGGSSDRNYVNAEGKKGSYISFARVFRREGKPCGRCGTIIIKIRVASRGTHICPKCQKLRPTSHVARVT